MIFRNELFSESSKYAVAPSNT